MPIIVTRQVDETHTAAWIHFFEDQTRTVFEHLAGEERWDASVRAARLVTSKQSLVGNWQLVGWEHDPAQGVAYSQVFACPMVHGSLHFTTIHPNHQEPFGDQLFAVEVRNVRDLAERIVKLDGDIHFNKTHGRFLDRGGVEDEIKECELERCRNFDQLVESIATLTESAWRKRGGR